ncbi:MAG: serine/threonine-protein kinase [Nostoc sp.]|uniref:serine/threonine-protein kinase n=1 Tax=Nostoc sp. TaxID=1180 RepID=UPI002FF7F2A5
MICCLNPACHNPPNPDRTMFCSNCGVGLVVLRNRYRPIKSLGGGGFGKTYLAEDIDKLNEYCVIKQFAPQVQGTGALQKATELFEQEAKQLQQLGKHPQIPTLLAYFDEDNRLYLVQEFIEGQNLLDELKQQGIFNEQKIRELLLDLLEILKTVHQQKVIHRDIKPENIIRRGDGKLVLIDFGASKQLTATVMPRSGILIGSLGYAPVEQMQRGEAFRASDLYSVGTTCFHLLSGIHPWELWQQHNYGWVANWRQHLQQPVSQGLRRMLDRLLQEEYQKRYLSAEEVLQDLNRLNPRPRWPKRLLTGVAVTLGGLVLTQFIGYVRYGLFPTNPISLIASKDSDVFFKRTLTGHSGSVNSVVISPDGNTLASGSGDNTIKLWNLATGKQIRTLPSERYANRGHFNSVYSVAISPDGNTLASGSGDNTIKLWNLVTGEQIRTLSFRSPTLPGSTKGTKLGGFGYRVNSVAISPDGKTIASDSEDGTIKLWNLETGKEIHTFKGHFGSVLSVAISPDGKTLASGSEDGTIKLWNLETGKEIRTITAHFNSVNSFAISLAIIRRPDEIPVGIPGQSEVNKVNSVAFSPDGKTLASGSNDKTIKLWNLATEKKIRTLTGHSDSVRSVAFSPDGKTLASSSGDKTIKLWSLETEEQIRTLTGHSDSVNSVAISPDGKTLVSGSLDKTIKIWRLR